MTGRARGSNAGVTLIEMLVALAVSSMIGVAGFVMLDGVTRTESSLTGRLDRIERQDRTFQLLMLDVQRALSGSMSDTLTLDFADFTATWSAAETGLVRKLDFPDGSSVLQNVLNEPARIEARSPGLLSVTLTNQGISRLFPLPNEFKE